MFLNEIICHYYEMHSLITPLHVLEKWDGMKLSEITHILQSTHKSAEFC